MNIIVTVVGIALACGAIVAGLSGHYVSAGGLAALAFVAAVVREWGNGR